VDYTPADENHILRKTTQLQTKQAEPIREGFAQPVAKNGKAARRREENKLDWTSSVAQAPGECTPTVRITARRTFVEDRSERRRGADSLIGPQAALAKTVHGIDERRLVPDEEPASEGDRPG